MSSQDTGPSGSEDSGDPVDKHIVQKAIKRRASLLGDDSRPGGSKRRRDASEEGELAASDPRRSGAIDLLSDTPSSSDASGSQHSDFHQADSATSSGSRQQDCIQPRRAALPPPVGVTVVEDDAATQSNEAQRLLRIPRYWGAAPDFGPTLAAHLPFWQTGSQHCVLDQLLDQQVCQLRAHLESAKSHH